MNVLTVGLYVGPKAHRREERMAEGLRRGL